MEQDFVIRPLNASDLNWMLEASTLSGVGFTSLPNDPDYIKRRLALVEESFAEQNKPEERVYLFIREDLPDNKRIGICGIKANVGYHDAFYNYQISTIVQTCEKLNIEVTHKLINVVHNFQDACELITFWIHPEFRQQKKAKYLTLCRFLFIAEHTKYFSSRIIAEIRGVCDDAGVSPFWEAVGRHFFAMDFDTADEYTLTKGKEYIAELISRDPIYLDLLPSSALAVIGVEHPSAKTARQILESQGFAYKDHVDIFDAGPLLEAYVNNIKTIINCKKAKLAKISNELQHGQKVLVYNCKIADARFTRTYACIDENSDLLFSEHIANVLKISAGDPVRYVLV